MFSESLFKMSDAWINFINSTDSLLNTTRADLTQAHEDNTLTVPLGTDDNSSLTKPIETWIASTTLTSFSFFTAPVMLAVGKLNVIIFPYITKTCPFNKHIFLSLKN